MDQNRLWTDVLSWDVWVREDWERKANVAELRRIVGYFEYLNERSSRSLPKAFRRRERSPELVTVRRADINIDTLIYV